MKAIKKASILLCLAMFASLFSGCTNTNYIIKANDKTYPTAPYAYYAHYLRDSWEMQTAGYYHSKLEKMIDTNADSRCV